MNVAASKDEEIIENPADYRTYYLTDEPQGQSGGSDSIKYASTSLVESMKQKSREKIEIQEKNFKEWGRKDMKFRWDLICKFSTSEIVPSDFQVAKLNARDQTMNLENVEWGILKKKSISKHDALRVSSRLYTLTRPINLRSQALKIDLEILLVGECQFNLVTRSNLLTNEETAVIRFTKFETYDSHRLFLMFGVLDKTSREIVLIKKTEIPIFKQKDEQMHIAVSIIDNGNDVISVSGIVNKNLRNTFRMTSEKILIPNFEDFNLLFYGLGTSVLLKTFRLEIMDRLSDDSFVKKTKEADCHACCNIF